MLLALHAVGPGVVWPSKSRKIFFCEFGRECRVKANSLVRVAAAGSAFSGCRVKGQQDSSRGGGEWWPSVCSPPGIMQR
jgi:hypothetical protein